MIVSVYDIWYQEICWPVCNLGDFNLYFLKDILYIKLGPLKEYMIRYTISKQYILKIWFDAGMEILADYV